MNGHDKIRVDRFSFDLRIGQGFQEIGKIRVFLELSEEGDGIVVVIHIIRVATEIIRHGDEEFTEAGLCIEFRDSPFQSFEQHRVVIDDLFNVRKYLIDLLFCDQRLSGQRMLIHWIHVLRHERVQTIDVAPLCYEHFHCDFRSLLVIRFELGGLHGFFRVFDLLFFHWIVLRFFVFVFFEQFFKKHFRRSVLVTRGNGNSQRRRRGKGGTTKQRRGVEGRRFGALD